MRSAACAFVTHAANHMKQELGSVVTGEVVVLTQRLLCLPYHHSLLLYRIDLGGTAPTPDLQANKPRRKSHRTYVDKPHKQGKTTSSKRRSRVRPESPAMTENVKGEKKSSGKMRRNSKPELQVNTSLAKEKREEVETPNTAASTPTASGTPAGYRGSTDLRSPGVEKTPATKDVDASIPDFITQTDANGNACTPRSPDAIKTAKEIHPTGPEPNLHVDESGKLTEDKDDLAQDACETLLDSIRLMCCCLLPEDSPAATARKSKSDKQPPPPIDVEEAPKEQKEVIKLLPKHHPDDHGKKCLVLDLDETLVHSSFRAVQGADFVIPVQVRSVVRDCGASFMSFGHHLTCLFSFLLALRLKMWYTLSMWPKDRVSTSFSPKWQSTTRLLSTLPVSTSMPIHSWICSTQRESFERVCFANPVYITKETT